MVQLKRKESYQASLQDGNLVHRDDSNLICMMVGSRFYIPDDSSTLLIKMLYNFFEDKTLVGFIFCHILELILNSPANNELASSSLDENRNISNHTRKSIKTSLAKCTIFTE